MWVNPIGSLNLYLQGIKGIGIEEGHKHFWFGKETLDPGAIFYPIVLISRYSPLLLGLLALGIYSYIKKKKNIASSVLDLVGVMLSFIFLYLLMMTIASKKLDRYSLPIIFPMALISSYYIPKLVSSRKILGFLVGLFIFFRIVLLYGFHPNYLAYYSPLVGGAELGRYVVEPKWLIGYDKIAKYFNEKKNPQDIKVAIADFDYLRLFAKFEVLNIRNKPERDQAKYFILPVYREDRNKPYQSAYELEQLDDKITVAGVDYYYIYKNNGPNAK